MSEITSLTINGGNWLSADNPIIYTFIDETTEGNSLGYTLQLESWFEGSGAGTWRTEGKYLIKQTKDELHTWHGALVLKTTSIEI